MFNIGAISGYFTANVNGYITATHEIHMRLDYRLC
jgi:hypothetical protein